MPRGGFRPGSGKPKGYKAPRTLQAQQYRAYLIAEVIKNKAPLVKALIDKGISGDVPALKEIDDRVMGKPEQAFDLTSKGEKLAVGGFTYVMPDESIKPDDQTH